MRGVCLPISSVTPLLMEFTDISAESSISEITASDVIDFTQMVIHFYWQTSAEEACTLSFKAMALPNLGGSLGYMNTRGVVIAPSRVIVQNGTSAVDSDGVLTLVGEDNAEACKAVAVYDVLHHAMAFRLDADPGSTGTRTVEIAAVGK